MMEEGRVMLEGEVHIDGGEVHVGGERFMLKEGEVHGGSS